MGRPPVIPPEKKIRIVLSILAVEMSLAEAARRAQVGVRSRGMRSGEPGPTGGSPRQRRSTHPRKLGPR